MLRSGWGFDEVGGQEGVCLAVQEGRPGQVIAVGRGRDAVGLEDLPDGGRCGLDSQDGEFTVDSSVAPPGIVARQTQDEGSDTAHGGASAGSSGTRESGVAAAQQIAALLIASSRRNLIMPVRAR